MEPSVYKYLLKYSTPQQLILTLMALVSFPFLYAFYELPKTIVNGAIQAESDVVSVPLFDVELDQMTYLFILTGLFLVLVIVNQGFKYIINVYRGVTGERLLRRLRYELYRRILRFPLPTFRKKSQGELISMITAEVEPLGGFIGEAFSLPAFQGGTLLVILAFLFVQNPLMASAAVALYPLQGYLIPKLQRRVNLLGKERVRRVRRMSERIGETVQGVQEIHAHDTSQLELAEFSNQLNSIYFVRYRIYLLKFVIKFLNNFIQQLGPFFFYAIGGYLTIRGELEIGTLLAAIQAQKDLGAPWKELLGFYQRLEDARIKYNQVVEQFAPAGMLPEELQDTDPESEAPLSGDIQAANLVLIDEQESNVVNGLSMIMPLGQRVAVVGAPGGGREELALLMARLMVPDKGSITIGGKDLQQLPESVTGRRLSYVGNNAFAFNQSLGDNLYYGLKHRPLRAKDKSDEGPEFERFLSEAKASGNSTADIGADWIDYAAAGAADEHELHGAALKALRAVDMDEDVYVMGLRGTLENGESTNAQEAIMRARLAVRDRLKDPTIAPLIEGFEPDLYNSNATVGENLLFGTPVGDAFDMDRLAEHPYVMTVLEKADLVEDMLAAGYQTAATMVELFADLPADHEFFQQFSFISAEELPDYQALLTRTNREQITELKADDRVRLLSLPFKLIPARHRLGVVTDELQAKILKGRKLFADELPDDLNDKLEFFNPERYNAAANIQDNILFGKIAYGQAEAQDRVGALIREVVDDLGLYDTVAEVGLNYHVGIGGSRLSPAMRQKLAIARALIKRPDLLVLSDATVPLDSASQAKILDNVLKEFSDSSVFWSLHRASAAAAFDYVYVMKGGNLVDKGTFEELSQDGRPLSELIAAE